MNKREREKGPFSVLHHVTVVVEDIDRAVTFYESLGIGPFRDYGYGKPDPEGRPGFYKKVRVAEMGQIQLQLVQPGEEDSLQKEFFERKGQGVQHLGFLVDDVDREEAKLKQLGLKVIESIRRPDGMGFAYFDTEEIGGVTLLIRQSPSK